MSLCILITNSSSSKGEVFLVKTRCCCPAQPCCAPHPNLQWVLLGILVFPSAPSQLHLLKGFWRCSIAIARHCSRSMCDQGWADTDLVCLFCAFLHKILRRKFCPRFGDVEVAANTRHRNETFHLSVIQQTCIIPVLQGLQVKQFLASC